MTICASVACEVKTNAVNTPNLRAFTEILPK